MSGSEQGAGRDDTSDAAATLAGEARALDSDLITSPGDAGSATAAGAERLRRLERGATLGRYVILQQVGRGGMSIVYAAYDPELDRRVAIKVLLPGRAQSEAARTRLQREAQAIASVSHPNVIAVHDVGIEAGRVFLAMEFVQGRDLAAWAKSRPKPAEILRVFVQAGEGLAAAHRAGLVHRDFKPENALLGDDGRVRVVDFGLVRRAEEATSSPSSHDDRSRAGLSATGRLTAVGALMGTPAYMAPEQFAGADADARTDQFSFCVALFEALYGERPYSGDTVASLSAAVITGRLATPSGLRDAPPHLYRVLARGLSGDPSARYPHMDALLADLRAEARGRPARALVALSILLGVTAVGWVAYRKGAGDRTAVCSGAAARRGEVWGSARVESMRAAFFATEDPLATRSFDRATTDVGHWLDQWEAVHREACLATRVRGERSEDLLDMQMVCLDGRMRALESVAQSFDAATPHVVLRAADAVADLPDPRICADLDALKQRVRLPDDLDVRREVEEIRDELARANGLAFRHETSEALDLLVRLRERAAALAYLPLEAEVERQYVLLSPSATTADAVASYERAFELALAAAHDEVAAEVASDLLYILAEGRDDLDEAESWARRSQALLRRIGGDARQEVQLLSNWAMLESRRGQSARARDMYEEAIERARADGVSAIPLAALYNNLGAVEAEMGLTDAATANMRRSVELREERLGELHPDTIEGYMNLGSLAYMDHRFDEAVRTMELAHSRAVGTRLESMSSFGNSLTNLCRAYRRVNQLDEAVEIGTRAVAWHRQRSGEGSWMHAEALGVLGLAQVTAGDETGASDSLQRSLSALEPLPGGDLLVADFVVDWAAALKDRGSVEAARELAQRWVDRMLSGSAEACALRALAISLGHLELDLGQPDAARRHFDLGRDLHGFDHRIGLESQLLLRLGWLRLGDHGGPSSLEGRAAAETLRRDAEREGTIEIVEEGLEAWLADTGTR